MHLLRGGGGEGRKAVVGLPQSPPPKKLGDPRVSVGDVSWDGDSIGTDRAVSLPTSRCLGGSKSILRRRTSPCSRKISGPHGTTLSLHNNTGLVREL